MYYWYFIHVETDNSVYSWTTIIVHEKRARTDTSPGANARKRSKAGIGTTRGEARLVETQVRAVRQRELDFRPLHRMNREPKKSN